MTSYDKNKAILALTNCAVKNDLGCQGCPYFEDRTKYGDTWCTTTMARDTLIVVRELDAMYNNAFDGGVTGLQQEEGEEK